MFVVLLAVGRWRGCRMIGGELRIDGRRIIPKVFGTVMWSVA